MKLKNIFVILLILLSLACMLLSCKKDDTAMPAKSLPTPIVSDWDGRYTLVSAICSPSQFTPPSQITIRDEAFESKGLNEMLVDSIHLQTNNGFAAIPAISKLQFNGLKMDFQGATFKKNVSQVQVDYSFKIYNPDGSLNCRPVYYLIYSK